MHQANSLRHLALLLSLAFPLGALAQEAAIETQVKTDSAAAASQDRIDKLDEQAATSLQAYRVATQRAESLSIYNQQLQKLINSQEAEIASITRQTEEIEGIETGALPFMIEMTDTLESIVEADVPFLRDERIERIESLRGMIDRADVTAGEKYRRIMEAYTIEADYGRTIEAYRGELNSSGDVRSVDFLRIGRVGLYYQTLDGSESGRWNSQRGSWEVLDGSYRRSVRDGLRVARKQAPPSLLRLPINSAEGA
ncbi:DUF3450 domain-containing protein [Mangrovimicrobium sediminis]|uniref:DUF3450 domain-containing protein n=1 Tax=Mangrovimicrobium sediminis TaxID=2562682 RepID=A0A4Z0M579_9GAMM|nr:DUF3450 domain-containing protein [Haliea sp. SAOS-164]TGD74596.1 DUF3450 domain-containing protein [Haliea sp. SAOS-164]